MATLHIQNSNYQKKVILCGSTSAKRQCTNENLISATLYINKCKKLNSLKQCLTATHGLHHTTKTAKIKKMLLHWQHVAIMSTCSYVIAPF